MNATLAAVKARLLAEGCTAESPAVIDADAEYWYRIEKDGTDG